MTETCLEKVAFIKAITRVLVYVDLREKKDDGGITLLCNIRGEDRRVVIKGVKGVASTPSNSNIRVGDKKVIAFLGQNFST